MFIIGCSTFPLVEEPIINRGFLLENTPFSQAKEGAAAQLPSTALLRSITESVQERVISFHMNFRLNEFPTILLGSCMCSCNLTTDNAVGFPRGVSVVESRSGAYPPLSRTGTAAVRLDTATGKATGNVYANPEVFRYSVAAYFVIQSSAIPRTSVSCLNRSGSCLCLALGLIELFQNAMQVTVSRVSFVSITTPQ
jgi:hypothetical protein